MIPNSKNNSTKGNTNEKADKTGSFSLFDPLLFGRRLLKNWYWFLIMFLIGYAISYVYSKYYAQRVYSSKLSLSISNNTASYFTPNQSINFIWGQNGNRDEAAFKLRKGTPK